MQTLRFTLWLHGGLGLEDFNGSTANGSLARAALTDGVAAALSDVGGPAVTVGSAAVVLRNVSGEPAGFPPPPPAPPGAPMMLGRRRLSDGTNHTLAAALEVTHGADLTGVYGNASFHAALLELLGQSAEFSRQFGNHTVRQLHAVALQVRLSARVVACLFTFQVAVPI